MRLLKAWERRLGLAEEVMPKERPERVVAARLGATSPVSARGASSLLFVCFYFKNQETEGALERLYQYPEVVLVRQ